jgi:hypothetical protein
VDVEQDPGKVAHLERVEFAEHLEPMLVHLSNLGHPVWFGRNTSMRIQKLWLAFT